MNLATIQKMTDRQLERQIVNLNNSKLTLSTAILFHLFLGAGVIYTKEKDAIIKFIVMWISIFFIIGLIYWLMILFNLSSNVEKYNDSVEDSIDLIETELNKRNKK